MSRRILFTGGGTAGHVTVNLALIPEFRRMGWEIQYIGSVSGIEKDLIEKLDVDYLGISTGKLRRYIDWQNVKDPFRVVKGVWQAYQAIRQWKPHILFSKGGFVSVPVVLAARMNRVPVIIHESDITPGLANKIAMPFATKVCFTFPEASEHVKAGKAVHVGSIIRPDLKQGQAARGLSLCDFSRTKPVILVMGGSQGSRTINETLRAAVPELTKQYQIIHICGKGRSDASMQHRGYRQFEYVHEELSDLMAAADVVITRAGSNTIFECLALRKPMLLIPLSRKASRGDQILNARSFKHSGFAEVLEEEDLTAKSLSDAVGTLFERKEAIVLNMKKNEDADPLQEVVGMIKAHAKQHE